MCKWFDEQGENSDVVFATKVRLSRNLSKYPFSKKISDSEAKQMVEEVIEKFGQYEDGTKSFLGCSLGDLSEVERLAMVERHVLSKEIAMKKQCSGLVVSEDESQSVLINEEDHLLIQSMAQGMNMNQAFENANRLDDYLSEQFEIAFSEKYGYLTSCPTNVGTGLKASYVLFLPALGGAGKIKRLADEVTKYGVTLQNIYSDGSDGAGSLYQLSNQKTMGVTETEIISNLDQIVSQVIKQERKRREYVLVNNYDEIEDQVYRSYGVLKYTKQMNSKDAMTLLSQIKFGADTNIIKFMSPLNIYKMIMEIQPNSLQCRNGKSVGSKVRDKLRAGYLNEMLPNISK